MRHIHLLLIFTFVLNSCKENEFSDESKIIEDKNKCHELPDFVIVKKAQINDTTFIINCHLDDNSIHQFMDGENRVSIIPIITNKNNNRLIYVEKQTLIGIDTVTLSQANSDKYIYYSIKFPSPKGGDITISKGLRIQ